MSGYLRDASNDGGFRIHPWIFLPSKLVYQNSSGCGQLQLPEELVVERRQLLRRPVRGVDDVEIAEHRLRRQHGGELLALRIGRVRHQVVFAGGDRVDLAARGVDAFEVGVALLADLDVDGAAVAAPHRPGGRGAARGALIAAEPAVDVEVVGGREIARRAGGDIHHPQIRLAVRPDWCAGQRADKRQAFAVR